jgi:hypothetical protein
VGGGLAWLYCDGVSLSTLNFSTFSPVAFDFRVTHALLVRGLGWALLDPPRRRPLARDPRRALPVTVALRTA